MRLILVDNISGFIFGDPIDYSSSSAGTHVGDMGSHLDFERLSPIIARQLDKSLGKHGRTYSFSRHAPPDTATGYQVYCVNRADAAPFAENKDPRRLTIGDVEANCKYVGFVAYEAA